MRSRNIKPDFFINDDLSDLSFEARLLFIGLWCYADRDGLFEWREKRIKAAIFPYDDVDIDKLLMSLHDAGCIYKYSNETKWYGKVNNFNKHQNPHPHEAKSKIPKPQQNQCHDVPVTLQELSVGCNADVRIEDVRIEDVRIDDTRIDDTRIEDKTKKPIVHFETFWSAFADKRGKEPALRAWQKIKPDEQLAQEIIKGAEKYAEQRSNITAKNGTPKMAQGWLTDKRWEDEDTASGEELTPQQRQIAKTGTAY